MRIEDTIDELVVANRILASQRVVERARARQRSIAAKPAAIPPIVRTRARLYRGQR